MPCAKDRYRKLLLSKILNKCRMVNRGTCFGCYHNPEEIKDSAAKTKKLVIFDASCVSGSFQEILERLQESVREHPFRYVNLSMNCM